MADDFAAAPNRTSESPTKANESVLLINESSLRDSPSVDDDAKSDDIEREKTVSPSLEIAEECIESFIHQGLENADNEHGQPASTLSDTYARNELEISKPLTDDHNKVQTVDHNRLQENILETIPLHVSEGQGLKEETSNIIMEAKNIINTCLLDAGNLDDRLSINADDDNIDNSEKELNEAGKEMDVEENFEKNIKVVSTMNDDSNHQRTCSKSKMNDSETEYTDIEYTEKRFNKEGCNVTTDDDGVYSREGDNFDATKDGKKDKKKHKHHKKHGKKKKKKHKKEKKAEKTKEKDSKVPELDNESGDEKCLEDQVFDSETDTNSAKPTSTVKDQSLESKSPQKRKLASIVAYVSSPIVSIASGKDELGSDQSTSTGYNESSNYDNSKRRSSERSFKSTEGIKDEIKDEGLHRQLSSTSKASETKDQAEEQSESSKFDNSKRGSSESFKSTESIKSELKEERLHRQSSSTSKTSETKDQAEELGKSSEYDDSKRRSTEKGSKSTESIKDEIKEEGLQRQLSSTSKASETKDQAEEHSGSSKFDNSKIRSSERSFKSTESIKDEIKEERLHRQLSSTSKASETKDQAEDDNTSYHSDKSSNEKHKKSKKKRRRQSRDEGQSKDSPQRMDKFSKRSSTKYEEKERRKRSESDDREGMELSRQHSHESSRRSSQSERRKSSSTKSEERERVRKRSESSDREPSRQHSYESSRRSSQSERRKSSSTKSEERERRKRSESSDREPSRQHSYESSRRSSQSERRKSRRTRSRSRDSDERPSSRDRYSRSRLRSRSKSKERSKRRRKSSRSKSNHRRSRSRSKSMDRIPKYRRESRTTSMDGQTKEEWLRDRERSRSDRERSRSRSVEKRVKRKRDSERSRKKSRDESSRSEVDSSTSELNKESKRGSFSKEHEALSVSPLLQKLKEKTPSGKTNRSDKTSDSTDWDQTSPIKRASKERSPISIESNASPRKHALLRSPSRERSSKKRSRTSTEGLGEDRINLNENSAVETLSTELARETDENDQRKAETKVEEFLDREIKDENSGNVVTMEDSEGIRKQMETDEISESGQTSICSNRQDEKGISNDTSEEVKTIGDELDSAMNKKDESSVISDAKSCIDKSSVQPEDRQNAKATNVDETMKSDRKMDSMSGRISDQNTTIVENDPFNQNSAGNTNNQFGIHTTPLPHPPPHSILTQNQFVDSNPPRGPIMGNIVCPPVVDPFARTFPDSGMLMHRPPIHQQPPSVPGCPVPQNISGPQIQSGNQNAFSQLNAAFAGNVVPQGFTLGPNQEPLKDNTSAPSPYIQQSSLLGLPTSASAIPFLGDEGPKISHEKKEEPSNNGDKTGAVDSNHAHASVPSPVDMDMSSPEEDIIDKMNEEFWEIERKGNEKDDNIVPQEKGRDTDHEPSTRNVLGGEEDYDPEHFVSCTSPKRKKKKDKTKKHSDSKPKTKVQSLLDKLHRQARVEEEVKIVLKDYYKHREIDKNEYKDILRKAVPQVANSDHSIDPERIRSLVKKYVAKVKGQRLLKPNS